MANWPFKNIAHDNSQLKALLTRFHRITRPTRTLEYEASEVIDCPSELLSEAPVRGLMRSCLSLSMRKQLLQAIHEEDDRARTEALSRAFSAYMLLQGRIPLGDSITDDGEFASDLVGSEGVWCHRQREAEAAPLAGFTLYPNPSAVGLHQTSGRVEPEPQAVLAVAVLPHPAKALK